MMAPFFQKLNVAPGVMLWRGCLDPRVQAALVDEVLARVREAPFYRPRMPRSGKPFSVEETNFGTLGWYSDEVGYRYETRHPQTHRRCAPRRSSTLLNSNVAGRRFRKSLSCCGAR
jgi:alkylated DNA repair dioxygenase AlkB